MGKGFGPRKYFWRLEMCSFNNLYLLAKVETNPRWWPSDRHPNMMRQNEVVARLVSHASILRCDEARLKGMTRTHSHYPLCELASLDDVNHLLL